MAMGIGLGALADGLSQGYGLGKQMQSDAKESKKEKAYDDAVTRGKADFDNAVANGEADANDAPASLRFAMPHIMKAAVDNKNLPLLEFASKWKETDEAKQGARLFESGTRRITVGDVEGGWSDFQKLGKLKGYGDNYEIGPLQPTADGKFETTITAPGGKEIKQTFDNKDQVALFVSRFGNPVLAAQSTFDAEKRRNDIADAATKYGAQKKIDVAAAKEGVPIKTEEYRQRKGVDLENAPQENASFLERHSGQKDIDIEADKKRQALGLGPGNYEIVHRTEQDENGKAVTRSYKMDKRSGTMTPIEGDGAFERAGRPSAGPGGRKPFQFEVVRDAYIKLGYSEQDAVDIATGKKPPRDTELINVARQITNMEMPASDMRYKAEQRKARMEEVLKGLQEQYKKAAPAAAPSAAPGAATTPNQAPGITGPRAPAPAPQASAQPPARPAPDRPDLMTPGNGNKPVDVAVPQRPAGVPPGSAYSPSRQMWRTSDGRMFDAEGTAVTQ